MHLVLLGSTVEIWGVDSDIQIALRGEGSELGYLI